MQNVECPCIALKGKMRLAHGKVGLRWKPFQEKRILGQDRRWEAFKAICTPISVCPARHALCVIVGSVEGINERSRKSGMNSLQS